MIPKCVQVALDWLRVDYPQGVPPTDYSPMLALLRRRLTDDQVEQIAHGLLDGCERADGAVRPHVIPRDDVHRAVEHVLHEKPTEAEIDRVRGVLAQRDRLPVGSAEVA